MKLIGIMCVRDEADLLPEVLEHLKDKVDMVYAYDDGSIDGTYKILCDAPVVSYVIRKEWDLERITRRKISRPNYYHLLEKIKKDHLGSKEPVWIFITMGDRFYLNKYPRQIAEEAEAGGYATVYGGQLDFLRHRVLPWTKENDTFPNYKESLRKSCKWFKLDEECIVAYKLSEERSYLRAVYPWPRGEQGKIQYKREDTGDKISTEVPFLEHQGRRSPNSLKWRIESGSRVLSKKTTLPSTSFDDIKLYQKKWYDQYKLIPWVDASSLNQLVLQHNEEEWKPKARKRVYWEALEEDILANGPHERKDI